jgi:hypothetical protein
MVGHMRYHFTGKAGIAGMSPYHIYCVDVRLERTKKYKNKSDSLEHEN